MAVNQIGNAGATSSVAASSVTSLGGGEMGKQEFLNLLVTQLRNQNPLEPMDQGEYAAQLAQFSSLEQLTNLNSGFDQMYESNIQLNQSMTNVLSTTLIGKKLRGVGNELVYSEDRDNMFSYRLGEDAAEVTVRILDANGNVVRTATLGPQASGVQEWSWDGRLDGDGVAGNGTTYQFEVEAVTAADESIAVENYIEGTISGVEYSGSGNMQFIVNGVKVATGEVYKIYTEED